MFRIFSSTFSTSTPLEKISPKSTIFVAQRLIAFQDMITVHLGQHLNHVKLIPKSPDLLYHPCPHRECTGSTKVYPLGESTTRRVIRNRDNRLHVPATQTAAKQLDKGSAICVGVEKQAY